MDSSDLLLLKESVETHKLNKAKLDGQLDQVKKDLKQKFKVSTLKEAKTKLDKMGKVIDKKEDQLEQKKQKLIEKYNAQV